MPQEYDGILDGLRIVRRATRGETKPLALVQPLRACVTGAHLQESETRTVAYKKYVTRYDHCGHPYTACVTEYKQVTAYVKKVVPVRKYVKVCD